MIYMFCMYLEHRPLFVAFYTIRRGVNAEKKLMLKLSILSFQFCEWGGEQERIVCRHKVRISSGVYHARLLDIHTPFPNSYHYVCIYV